MNRTPQSPNLDRRARRMPQKSRSSGSVARSTSPGTLRSASRAKEGNACGSCRCHGKRQTVSHSSLDGADAAHRLHRLIYTPALEVGMDKDGGPQAD